MARPHPRGRDGRAPRCEHGFAVLLSVVLIAVVATAVLMLRPGTASGAAARAGNTALALAHAKEALIARAVADANRPGSLPCPDTDGDGSTEIFQGNECRSYVGRLPWRTLGLPEPRDDRGDVLWYALARGFRDNAAVEPLNSDSPAQLTLDGGGNIAAIVFSAGPPLAGQGGRPGNAVADWLDGANADGDLNFATCPRPLGSRVECENVGGGRTAFNDRALAVTRAELMRAVEQRIGGEVRKSLRTIFETHHSLPNAARLGYFPDGREGCQATLRNGFLPIPTCSCDCKIDWCDCRCQGSAAIEIAGTIPPSNAWGSCSIADNTVTCINSHDDNPGGFRAQQPMALAAGSFGLLAGTDQCSVVGQTCNCAPPTPPRPLDATLGTCVGTTSSCAHPMPAIPDLPEWFFANQWHHFVYYAVSGLPPLQIDGMPSPALIITAGSTIATAPFVESKNPASTQLRPQWPPSLLVNDYLDTLQNANGDYIFGRAQLAPNMNDQVFVVP